MLLTISNWTGLKEAFRVECGHRQFRFDAYQGCADCRRWQGVCHGCRIKITAVDTKTGSPLWTRSVKADYSEPNRGLTRFLGISEKPAPLRDGFGGGIAYDGGRLFVTTGFGELLAFNANSGEILWRVQSAVAFSNAPTVRAGRLYVASQDSRLQAYNIETVCCCGITGAINEGATIMGATSAAVNEQVVVAGFQFR